MERLSKTSWLVGAASIGLTILGSQAYQRSKTPGKQQARENRILGLTAGGDNDSHKGGVSSYNADHDDDVNDNEGPRKLVGNENDTLSSVNHLSHCCLADMELIFEQSLTSMMCDGTSDEQYSARNAEILERTKTIFKKYEVIASRSAESLSTMESEIRLLRSSNSTLTTLVQSLRREMTAVVSDLAEETLYDPQDQDGGCGNIDDHTLCEHATDTERKQEKILQHQKDEILRLHQEISSFRVKYGILDGVGTHSTDSTVSSPPSVVDLQISALQKELEDCKKELSETKESMQKEVEGKKRELESIREKMSKMDGISKAMAMTETSSIETDLIRLSNTVIENKRENVRLSTEVNEARAENARLKCQLENIGKLRAGAELSWTTAEREREELQSTIENNVREVERCNAVISLRDRELEEVSHRCDTEAKRANAAEEELHTTRDHLEDLRKKTAEVIEEELTKSSRLEKTATDLSQSLERNEGRLMFSLQQLSDAEESLRRAEEEIAGKKSELEVMQSDLSQALERISKQDVDLKSQEKIIKDMEGESIELRHAIERMKEAHLNEMETLQV